MYQIILLRCRKSESIKEILANQITRKNPVILVDLNSREQVVFDNPGPDPVGGRRIFNCCTEFSFLT